MVSKKWIIGICITFIIALGIVSGLYIYTIKGINNKLSETQNIIKVTKEDNNINNKSPITNDIGETIEISSKAIKLSPNAVLILEKFYQQCSYTVSEELVVPYNIVNLTENEVQEQYPDWTIREFSNDKLIMYKVFEDRCDEHYLIKEKNGYIEIYSENKDGSLEFLEQTDISIEYLTSTDKEHLQKGIKIHGKTSLEKMLEDYE